MKHTLLFLLGLLSYTFSFAQAIVPLEYESFEEIEGNILITGDVEAPGDVELTTHFHVQNVSDEAITLEVRRILVSEVAGSSNKFCWAGVCYSEDDDFSLNIITINPDEIFNSDNPAQQFKGYYYHNGNPGMTTINYRFTDVNDNQNNSFITVDYAVEGNVGLTEVQRNEVKLDNASPNPSSSTTMISYDFGRRPSNGVLVISDMMGKRVKEIPVEERYGVLLVGVSDLPAGIYMYSLSDSNQILQTRKLVVNR